MGFDWLLNFVSGSPWTYAALLAIAALDAILPLVPSETAVITAGVLAASGDLILLAVVASAAAGALLGDNTSYFVGDRLDRRGAEKVLRGERGRRGLNWAERMLDERGGILIVTARFIPGGRTATTLTAGVVDYPWRTRFLPFASLAAACWAGYAAALGYFGGKTFEDEPWKGLLVAFALAGGIALGVEVVRHVRHRRR